MQRFFSRFRSIFFRFLLSYVCRTNSFGRFGFIGWTLACAGSLAQTYTVDRMTIAVEWKRWLSKATSAQDVNFVMHVPTIPSCHCISDSIFSPFPYRILFLLHHFVADFDYFHFFRFALESSRRSVFYDTKTIRSIVNLFIEQSNISDAWP